MTLRALIVDDEPLARARLRTLLGECIDPTAQVAAEAGNATQAMELIMRERFDLALIDIHMPGADGLKLAQAMRGVDWPPMVVFVTAHPGHAVTAFELDAVDYLTKPVRIERLRQALVKAERFLREREAPADEPVLVIQDRGRTERVPFAEILYFKAELKYVTVRTAARSYILDGSLAELESRLTGQFLRIHRNALVARRAVRSLEKHYSTEPGEEGEGWAIRLTGVQEVLAVSRRQLAAVREAIAAA